MESSLNELDEIWVQFNEVELIVGRKQLEDAIGHRGCSRSDLEDPDGNLGVPCSKEAGHGRSKEAATGGDGSGCSELCANLREECEVALKRAIHEINLRSGRQESTSECIEEARPPTTPHQP